MAEYRLDVRSILDEVGGSIHVVDTLDIPELVVGEETFTLREPARFDVHISNVGEAFVPTGRVKAPVTATCSRCLCEFDTEITGDVEGYWPRPGHTPPEEEDVTGELDSEMRIDLAPALIAALVIEAPFAPLHDEDCAGLCPECGADLNEGPCACTSDRASDDHPFAALKGLLNEEKGDGEQ